MSVLKNSIRKKLIVFLLISLAVPMVASIIISYAYTINSLKEQATTNNLTLLTEGNKNLNTYLKTLQQASLLTYSSGLLDSILSNQVPDYQRRSYILSLMQSISRSTEDVLQVYLELDKFQSAYLLHQNNLSYSSKNYSPSLPVGRSSSVYFEHAHLSHDYGISQYPRVKQEVVFTLQRNIYASPSNRQIGFLAIDIPVDVLSGLVKGLYNPEDEDFYIVDAEGGILYAANQSFEDGTLEEEWVSSIQKHQEDVGYLEWDRKEFSGIIIFKKINTDGVDWTLIKRIPYSSIYEFPRNLTQINLIVAAFFLLVAMFAILMVSLHLTKPLKLIISHIRKIKKGQLDETLQMNRTDEFGLLAEQFQTMMHTINELILREYKLQLANRTNQLKMLQAQINPHFLNNALQSIGHLSLDGHPLKVYKLVSSLGQMMQYSMNTRDTLVPLAYEMEHVGYYCELQKERFEDQFQVTFQLADATKSIIVPKMIVQPIVENFFKHGFTAGSGPHQARLDIQSELVEGCLRITVSDNGPGMEAELLAGFGLHPPDGTDLHTEGGIGLDNVLERLRLYYGENALMELSNRVPCGLQVTLIIPLNHSHKRGVSDHESVIG